MTTAQARCELCLRRTQLTLHHLIPRKLHRRNWFRKNYSKAELQLGVNLCRQCHRGLHKMYSEMHLGKTLNTIDKLKADPAVVKHVSWVAKQRVAAEETS